MAMRRQLSRRRMESMFAVVLWAIGKASELIGESN
jgi:hypothetical protein